MIRTSQPRVLAMLLLLGLCIAAPAGRAASAGPPTGPLGARI
jgi:hypothetical protein